MLHSSQAPVRGVSDLVELIHSASMAQVAYVAAELCIADHLASGPKDAVELARLTRTNAPSLHRILRALASLGLCTEREDGSFALGPLGSRLRTGDQSSLRSWILWNGQQWGEWGNLLHSVRTGESARKLATGIDGFDHLTSDPAAAAIFNDAMVEMTRLIAGEVVRVYDFSGMQQIIDVGGGLGALMAAVLEANSDARGQVLDLAHAVDGARAYLTHRGVMVRCEVIAGDFFESVPGGADAYILKNIIHDWNDARSSAILRNCRRAMPAHGKLLLVERIMPDRLEASSLHRAIAWADLTMLVGPGGCQRTKAEFQALLDGSGLRMARIIATDLEYSVIEAVPR